MLAEGFHEVGSAKLEVRSWKCEVGSAKLEVRSWKCERRRADGRGARKQGARKQGTGRRGGQQAAPFSLLPAHFSLPEGWPSTVGISPASRRCLKRRMSSLT